MEQEIRCQNCVVAKVLLKSPTKYGLKIEISAKYPKWILIGGLTSSVCQKAMDSHHIICDKLGICDVGEKIEKKYIG